ncbi:MAG: 50S ribosomal protein L23 [Nitrospinae bacterium RIFCSPLOWO2_12_FULL_45_22]|uniref:Large ribosomal subunit protein uL23 n=1 Tax=uncultured bacterium Rifle_16ft_4_minimus_4226 TaxID=1665160 RepID=A0A0H4T8K0_9BACT|nr:50S ribosomal protein L23 [uncultured bacterium Rifle_16ft_4_minimus_4226]OGW14978.1 MAG: 50S ribosomal protein L23 [Nitrospinae bacterium RIFCSPLOWO2_12_FULL_45_22]
MKDPYSIIKKPIITEKSTLLKEAQNKVLFQVATHANKKEIKQAIEKLFGVTVLGVNTLKVRGKVKGLRMRKGKRPDWKKAFVTLKEGDKIEFFEGV